MILVAQPDGADKDQLGDTVAVLHRKFRSQITTQRKPDQTQFGKVKRIEQVEIVHDVVVWIGHRGVVAGLAESRMKRDYDTELLCPRLGKIEARERPRSMPEDQRLALAGSKHDRVYPV